MPDSYFVTVLGHPAGRGGPTLAMALPQSDALILRASGAPDLRLPYAEMTIEIDPADPERVLLSAPGLGETRVAVDDRRIAEQLAALAPPQVGERWRALQDRGRARRRTGAQARMLALAAAVLAPAAGFWFGYDALVAYAVSKIPVRYESRLSALSGSAEGPEVKDPVVNAAVSRVAARLLQTIPNSPYQFQVTVVADPRVNAFALPGGRIVVLSGLVAASESPDELAGVLAHEIQHVLRRHGLNGLIRKLGVQVIFLIALSGRGAAADALKNVAPGLLNLRFSRAQEAEADRGGLELLLASNVPPTGMINFFRRQSKDESGTARALNFASDHPTSQHRLEVLESLAHAYPVPPSVDWGLDWNDIRARCRAAKAGS